MSDKERGLYEKYTVIRNDGKEKHSDCQYFVLDLDHDPHARAALAAYRESCKAEYPALANDIHALLYGCEFGGVATADRHPGQNEDGESLMAIALRNKSGLA